MGEKLKRFPWQLFRHVSQDPRAWSSTNLTDVKLHCYVFCPTSFAIVAMKTVGRAVAISESACLADRWVSADGDNGKPFLNVRSRFLLSADSSNKAIRTADTSIYGSQSVNPRPIKSMAALLTDVCAVSCEEGGLSRRYINALPVSRTVA